MASHKKSRNSLFYLFSLYFYLNNAVAFNPVSAYTHFAYDAYNAITCGWRECCTEEYVRLNLTGLQNDLALLHGQHLVTDTVIRSLRGHFSHNNPKKALVLSFHGPTGSGKNYVANIIANNLFLYGMQSRYVRFIIATHHFPHNNFTETYRAQLREWIQRDVAACRRSLFIIDEMDKMPIEVMDAITPFIDHYPEIDGVDYRKATFIFLSNTGSHAIIKATQEHLSSGAKKREDLVLADLEHLVTNGAFEEKGGLERSKIIEKHLITAFIPFLPMERRHVMLCIQDDTRRKNLTVSDEVLNRVADSLEFYPDDTRLFSTSGCKRVSQKVDLFVDNF